MYVCTFAHDVFILLVHDVFGFTLLYVLLAVLLEKILRVQPNVKKLYLLLRTEDAKSATHRLHNEVNAQHQLGSALCRKCHFCFGLLLISFSLSWVENVCIYRQPWHSFRELVNQALACMIVIKQID